MCNCLSWAAAAVVLSQSTFKPINFGFPIASTKKMHDLVE